MDEFHFLRPWWLLALPVGVWLAWTLLGGGAKRGAWRKVVEGPLQPHVLAAPRVASERWLPLAAAIAAWILATVALAGPAWERLPVPAFRDAEALVVALDLSRSMDATDLEPSRLAQARLKLLALLERRQAGQTGLVVFSTHAFTVTPLTTDKRTIAALVGALATDIMPRQGSVPESALERAGQLLRQTGVTAGDILLITDSTPSPRAIDTARSLAREGYVVHVLAVGTEQGAPIALSGGGFLTDTRGRVVVPGVDAAALRRLAGASGGRFAVLTPDERDLDALFPSDGAGARGLVDRGDDEYLADVWQDRGAWLVLALLPLVLLGFRRGWIAVLVACVVLPAPRAEAFVWADLWERPDQRGLRAFQSEDTARAAELFEHPEWRAAALYRTGDYLASAASLEGIDTALAHYNRGNALARAGLVPAAIEAYERALELDPEHEDARHNRDLLEELLRDNPQSAPPPAGGGEQGERQSSGENEEETPDGQDQQDEQPGSEGDSQSPAPEDGGGEERGGDSAAGSDEQGTDPTQTDTAGGEDGGEEAGDASAEALGPDEVEEWASEQAIEQWLRRIPQDPGGLLRRKFQYQYQRLGVDQDGNYLWPAEEAEPW